ncbi:hypothetical protein [Bacillus sp. AP50]|uniref:hypothetical protein n=1 Tax=Bacillus sp. AP50 TaxID=3122950 RepID=UPI003391D8FE
MTAFISAAIVISAAATVYTQHKSAKAQKEASKRADAESKRVQGEADAARVANKLNREASTEDVAKVQSAGNSDSVISTGRRKRATTATVSSGLGL